MRKFFLSLLLLFFTFFLTNQSFSQINLNWKWSHPKPQGNTLRYVKMFSATTWYAVGYAGSFIKTTDGGSSWSYYANAGGSYPYGLGKTLYSGWFFNMNTGLVSGVSGWIGRTTDGGATWDSIPSGVTASLYGIHFVNANTGFIGGSSGTILKSTNAGATWSAVTSGTTSTIENIYAVDVNHIYAPSTSGNLRISTDGGTTWTQYATGGSTLYDANFGNANTGFVCGSSGHVIVTTNGGTNWTSINPAGSSTWYELSTFPVTLPPSNLLIQDFEGTTYPPTGWTLSGTSGIWSRNTQCSGYGVGTASSRAYFYGVSSGSQNLNTSTFTATVAGDSLIFDHAYATFTTEDDQLRISTSSNGGTNWTQLVLLHGGVSGELVTAPPTTSNFVPTAAQWGTKRYALPVGTNALQFTGITAYGNNLYLDNIKVVRPGSSSYEVYVIGSDAFYIYHSSNLGGTWDTINHLDPSQIWTSTWYSMDKNGSALVAVGASGLMNRSTNGGSNWTNYNTWIFAGTFYDVWAEYNNTKVMAVGSGSNTTKGLRSTNGGTTWIAMDNITTTSKYFRSISMVNSNTGYICGSSGGMFKTTNGGASWDSLPFPGTQLLYNVDFVNATTGWTSSSSSSYLWKTTNGGTTWTSQSGPTSAVYCVDMVDANTGWFCGSSGKIWNTTNGGTNWAAQTSGTTSTLYWVSMVNANTGYVCGSSGTLKKTTDGGTNWATITTPYSTTYYKTDWVNANNGFVVGSSAYTTKTTDGGTTWSIETTSGSTTYGIYMNSPDSAWACGSLQAVYKWAKAPQGVANWNNEVPATYYIDQNYPNPFNPATTIKFGIPKAGNVSLNVYDITGRLVKTLFNNAPLNPGTVTYKFDGTNFASGVYFYTLIVDNNKIDTKKMVLVK
jgi:photosystem II stability/assembly factor-like uncharacterized protein